MIYVGTRVRFRTLCFTLLGVQQNPTDLTLKLYQGSQRTAPTQTVAMGSLANPLPGSFHFDWLAVAVGEWGWEWTATGGVAATAPGTIYVKDPAAG